MRVDKWLWAVRVFKTRSTATTACRHGQVRIGSQRCKPSRMIGAGETLDVEKHNMTITVKVLALLDNRVGAKLVPDYLEDQTPEEEIEKARRVREERNLNRVMRSGDGRPTKQKRRRMQRFLDEVAVSNEIDNRAAAQEDSEDG